jgi:hypothetical protein
VRVLSLDAAPFERILEMHTDKGSTLTDAEANSLFSNYMTQIEKVIEAVDRIDQ